jgi:hypothetical protein
VPAPGHQTNSTSKPTGHTTQKTPTTKTKTIIYEDFIQHLLLLFKFKVLQCTSIDGAVTHMNQNMNEPDDDYIYNRNV